jgi:rhodanese-related sulfurtransferase
MKKHLTEVFYIGILAVGIALATNALRSDGLPLSSDRPSNDSAPLESSRRRIGIDSAIAHFNRQDALFADARPAADFAAGHIAGAVSLPVHQPDDWFEKIFTRLEPEKTVITYCAGSECTLGQELAQVLTEAGFENVFYLVDGWGQWTARNLPVETGK